MLILETAANKRPPLRRPFLFQSQQYRLTDRRGARAGDDHGLAGLHDLRGLAVIRAGPGGDAERRNRNTGYKRDDHDLQMGTAIS